MEEGGGTGREDEKRASAASVVLAARRVHVLARMESSVISLVKNKEDSCRLCTVFSASLTKQNNKSQQIQTKTKEGSKKYISKIHLRSARRLRAKTLLG